ncbi:MAG: FMN-binding protein [Acidobacteria bacterium]|nr:FMN-binding protein [Acidobacteriota bacterium]NIM62777.1 FMN-binding protein [Acidobacteriota bacterium]NIO59077.1 FMN-binding protein [Acidobacteriota bacterium]NIQ30116.1 FMN-binding protein [Acidobacteriota bacterium]NIQ84919.1 FMN-binding protein [Acidobacteriota bacterium]
MSSDFFQRWALVCAIVFFTVAPAGAKVLVTVEEALASAFPDSEVTRQTVFLTETELSAATELAGKAVERALTVRYVAHREGSVVGTAYFDVHRVRTLEETLLVVVQPDGTVGRVEVVSFDEPLDYLPRDGWYRQFDGRPLDDDLDLDRAIRSVSGATLTAVATTAATRRVLAVHRILEKRDPAP